MCTVQSYISWLMRVALPSAGLIPPSSRQCLYNLNISTSLHSIHPHTRNQHGQTSYFSSCPRHRYGLSTGFLWRLRTVSVYHWSQSHYSQLTFVLKTWRRVVRTRPRRWWILRTPIWSFRWTWSTRSFWTWWDVVSILIPSVAQTYWTSLPLVL